MYVSMRRGEGREEGSGGEREIYMGRESEREYKYMSMREFGVLISCPWVVM